MMVTQSSRDSGNVNHPAMIGGVCSRESVPPTHSSSTHRTQTRNATAMKVTLPSQGSAKKEQQTPQPKLLQILNEWSKTHRRAKSSSVPSMPCECSGNHFRFVFAVSNMPLLHFLAERCTEISDHTLYVQSCHRQRDYLRPGRDPLCCALHEHFPTQGAAASRPG